MPSKIMPRGSLLEAMVRGYIVVEFSELKGLVFVPQ